MREGVTYKRLGEICDTTSGGTPSKNVKEYYENGNIPWIRSGELSQGYIYSTELFITQKGLDNSSAKIVPVNTVSIAMYGATVGEVGIIKTPMCTNQAICNILPNSSFIPEYLRYFLVSKKPEFINIAAGGAQPNISQAIIRNTLLPLLSLSSQELIVRELDSISSVISAKKQQVLELDNLAQAIFLDTFGDPITNPKGWEVKKMGEVATEFRYGTSKPASPNGKYKYLRMCNLTYDGYLDLTDVKTIDIPDNEIEKCIVRRGDVLFNRTNSLELIGKTCMFDEEESMVIAGYIIRVRLNDEMLPIYMTKAFNMPSMKKLLKAMAKGAVNQVNINAKELASISIPLPPLSLQQAFAEKVQVIEEQKRLINQSIAEFESLLAQRMEFHFA